MTSDISVLRESVINYWHNNCTIHHLADKTIVIHNKRQNIVYVGGWNKETNLPHGKGKQYKSIGRCEKDGTASVNGVEYPYGKVSHKGSWNNGLYEGFGLHWYIDGTMYKGHWTLNKFDGFGTLYDTEKRMAQKGTWKKGVLFNGYGKIVNRQQKTYFIGNIENGYITSNGNFYNMYNSKKLNNV